MKQKTTFLFTLFLGLTALALGQTTSIRYPPSHTPVIEFSHKSDTLSQVTKDTAMGYLFELLKDNPTIVIELDGHADEGRNGTANYALSMYRALTCKNYLSAMDIEPARIEVKALGSTKPLFSVKQISKMKSDSAKETARAHNRYVSFKITRSDFVAAKKDTFTAKEEMPTYSFNGTRAETILDSVFVLNDVNKASECMEREQSDSAKMFIDKPMLFSSVDAWLIKGYIYKELYKKYEFGKISSAYRNTALNALFISYYHSSSKEDKAYSLANIKYLAATYYNDAIVNLDTVHYRQAIMAYFTYKHAMKQIEPSINFKERDISFYESIGNIYTLKISSDIANFIYKASDWDSAFTAYNYILTNIDSTNYVCNYSIMLLCHNFVVLRTDTFIDTTENRIMNMAIILANSHASKKHQIKPFNKEERREVAHLFDDYFAYIKKAHP